MKKEIFVVLEGLDGSGKTTIAKLLAKRMGAYCVHTPLGYYKEIRYKVDENQDPLEHFFFYLSAIRYASQKIRSILLQSPVVCDRYIYTTITYHRALGITIDVNSSQLDLIEPDFIFFLNVSQEQQRIRFSTKQDRSKSDDYIVSRNLHSRLNQEYERFQMIKVETDEKMPEEIVEEILKIITR